MELTRRALLALEDGTVFEGCAFGATASAVGEVIFNTSITGYQEIITDPSYAKQIVTLTHPQIGNIGINSSDIEANVIHASSLVIKSLPKRISSWRSESSLPDFLKMNKIAGIYGIDTRKLTRLIRTKGAQNGCVTTEVNINPQSAIQKARDFEGLKGMDLAKIVSTKVPYTWNEGLYDVQTGVVEHGSQINSQFSVVAYDFGIKQNILRMLVNRGCSVMVVPAETPFSELPDDIDGIFLSNGPGDPEPCVYAVDSIKQALQQSIPIFGICLGHQLLGLALGAHSMKMKFGHHGANHPVRDLSTGEIMITSQNHGFAVDDDSLPGDVVVTHRSLFDGTIQGLRHTRHPVFSFQGHPEASPGPHDCRHLFDQFIDLMKVRKNQSEMRRISA